MFQDRSITAVEVAPVVRRLAEIRMAWGLTQKEVAQRIGCNYEHFNRVENGRLDPGYKLLAKWADVLGYTVSIWPKESGKKDRE